MSRIPWDVKSTSNPILINSALVKGIGGESFIPMNSPDQLVLSKHMNVKMAPRKTKDERKELQAADIGPVITLLKTKQLAQYVHRKVILLE